METENRRKMLFVAGLVATHYLAFFAVGIAQQELYRKSAGAPETFQSTLLLTTVAGFTNFAFALLTLWAAKGFSKGRVYHTIVQRLRDDGSLCSDYVWVSLTFMIGKVASNHSLTLVDYATQALAKCAKPVSVVLLGVLHFGIRFKSSDVICSIWIVSSLVLFNMFSFSGSDKKHQARNTVQGNLLLLLSLICDGLTGARLDRLVARINRCRQVPLPVWSQSASVAARKSVTPEQSLCCSEGLRHAVMHVSRDRNRSVCPDVLVCQPNSDYATPPGYYGRDLPAVNGTAFRSVTNNLGANGNAVMREHPSLPTGSKVAVDKQNLWATGSDAERVIQRFTFNETGFPEAPSAAAAAESQDVLRRLCFGGSGDKLQATATQASKKRLDSSGLQDGFCEDIACEPCIVEQLEDAKTKEETEIIGSSAVRPTEESDGLHFKEKCRDSGGTNETCASYEMMCTINLIMAVFSGCLSLFVDGFQGVDYLRRHPEALYSMYTFCILGALGQLCSFKCVSYLGSLQASTITTTRKVVMVLVSVGWSRTPLHTLQWLSILSVSAAVAWRTSLSHRTQIRVPWLAIRPFSGARRRWCLKFSRSMWSPKKIESLMHFWSTRKLKSPKPCRRISDGRAPAGEEGGFGNRESEERSPVPLASCMSGQTGTGFGRMANTCCNSSDWDSAAGCSACSGSRWKARQTSSTPSASPRAMLPQSSSVTGRYPSATSLESICSVSHDGAVHPGIYMCTEADIVGATPVGAGARPFQLSAKPSFTIAEDARSRYRVVEDG